MINSPILSTGDPLLSGKIDGTVLLIVLVKTLVVFAFLLTSVMLMIWYERKMISDMQDRVGPNRAGPWGLLQTLADGIKLFFKEDLLPEQADKRVFRLAPYLALIPAFMIFAIVPLGGEVTIAGHTTRLQLADPPIGILFFLVMSAVAVYGVMLAGWSSGSKYPLLGSVRASGQMISYEAALGLSIAAVVLVTGSLYMSEIVTSQHGNNWFTQWNIFRTAAVPFFIFLIAGTAELNRPPFDLVEAEQELVGGFQTEYSSMRFAMFYLAEFMNTITVSCLAVALFLGGGAGPHIEWHSWIWPTVWFGLKLYFFLFLFVWLRATLPRLRYDQLMDFGWKKLIPISLGWLMILAAFIAGDGKATLWERSRLGVFTLLFVGVCGLLLTRAMRLGRELSDPNPENQLSITKETV